MRLNHSNAIEVTEETTLSDSGAMSGFEEDHNVGDQSNEMINEQLSKETGNLMSPTIPIPSSSSPSSKRNQLSTIDCEIGSKVSTEDTEMFMESMVNKRRSIAASITSSSSVKPSNFSDHQTQYQISDMSAESLIWLAHRLGPVLTARHLSRNLLKMLTLCYIGQENLMPSDLMDNNECTKNLHDDLLMFTIADGRVSGDRSAIKVLECLTSICSIYGSDFILLQYFPHVTELIALCKKRITPSLEGGLISSLQLLKYIVPCLSDATIMDQLQVS